MRFYSTLRQHSAIKIFLYNIIFKKSRALHIWSKLLLFLGRRKIQIIFSPQKVFEFFAPNRKKNLAIAIIFFWKIIIWFFFQINLQNFCFVMMTKKEAFAGGIRSSQSTVFKNLENVKKKYYALNKILRCKLLTSTNIENMLWK